MKEKIRKYIGGRVVCVVIIVLCVLLMAVYGLIQIFAARQLDDREIPHIGSKTYISITDDRFSDKVYQGSLVLGTVKEEYSVGEIVAVRLSDSDLVTVVPNTCGNIAVVQIVSAAENTYAVAYNDTDTLFYVTEDAVLSDIGFQLSYLGVVMEWMLSPMSFLFWLILPLLVLVLCIVVIAYLKEKHLRSVIAGHKLVQKESAEETKPQEESKAKEEKTDKTAPKTAHPLLSGEEGDNTFPVFKELPSKENDSLANEISKKIAAISAQEQADRETLNLQLNAAMDAAKKGTSVPVSKSKTQIKTTVVYEVGEQKAQVKEAENVSDDDLDLMMLQDKIENIIHNNNRRLENEVEQKLRGLGTEKEKAQRELEKTREFFISPEHLSQSAKKKNQ